MGSPSAPAPIIIVRRKKGHSAHHGGAWKVAYADFVTAMMALFMVLWLLSSSEKVKKAVGGYFQDPTGVGKMAGSNMAGAGEALTVAKDDMSQLKEKLEQAMRELPKFEQIKDNIEITVTSEGLRIELLEKEGGLFFENGSPKPLDKTVDSLMGEQLKSRRTSFPSRAIPTPSPRLGGLYKLNCRPIAPAAHGGSAGGMEGRVAQIRVLPTSVCGCQRSAESMNRRVSVLVQYATAG